MNLGAAEWIGLGSLVVTLFFSFLGIWRWQAKRFNDVQGELNGGLNRVADEAARQADKLEAEQRQSEKWLRDAIEHNHVELLKAQHAHELRVAQEFATVGYLKDVEGRVTSLVTGGLGEVKQAVNQLTIRVDSALQSNRAAARGGGDD